MFVMSLSLCSPLWRYTNIINKIPCMVMSCKVLLMFDRPIIDKTVNYIDQLNNTLVMYQVLTSTDLEGLTLINRLKLSALTWSSYGMFFDGGVSPKRKKKKIYNSSNQLTTDITGVASFHLSSEISVWNILIKCKFGGEDEHSWNT